MQPDGTRVEVVAFDDLLHWNHWLLTTGTGTPPHVPAVRVTGVPIIGAALRIGSTLALGMID